MFIQQNKNGEQNYDSMADCMDKGCGFRGNYKIINFDYDLQSKKKFSRSTISPITTVNKKKNQDMLEVTDFQSFQEKKSEDVKKQETESQPIYSKTTFKGLKQSISNYFGQSEQKNDNQQCNCEQIMGQCSKAQKWIKFYYPNKEIIQLQVEYQEILDKEQLDEQSYEQIIKDISRSYPDETYFKSGFKGYEDLKSVLITYSKYDPQLSYMQGMNLLAGSILFHTTDYMGFWILVSLLQQSNLRDLYIKDLPGHAKHAELIEFLIFTQLRDLYLHFCKNQITAAIFISPWLFSLFSVMIPIQYMGYFLDYFIDQGWIYFYKLVISILKTYQKQILQCDQAGIFMFLTQFNNRKSKDIQWIKFLQKANEIKLDQNFIKQMHQNFDCEKKTFKI